MSINEKERFYYQIPFIRVIVIIWYRMTSAVQIPLFVLDTFLLIVDHITEIKEFQIWESHCN